MWFDESIEITGIVMVREAVGVPSNPVDTEHDASVLDSPIWIKEFRAHASDRLLFSQADHLLQPISIKGLDIVIDEGEHVARGCTGGRVVQCRKIKRPGLPQQANRWFTLQLAENADCSVLNRSIVHDDNVVVLIARPLTD